MKLIHSLFTLITLIISCNATHTVQSPIRPKEAPPVANKENECCAFMEGDACFCKTQSTKNACDCDTITSLSVVYLGETPAKFIKFYNSNRNHLCKFNNLNKGDEITCNPSPPSSSSSSPLFTDLTTFKIKTFEQQLCTGYIDTSCEENIINAYGNGCDDIVVTGYVGDGDQICEDGFEPCTCDENENGLHAVSSHKLRLYIPVIPGPGAVGGAHTETFDIAPETLDVDIDDDIYEDIYLDDSSDDFYDSSVYESSEETGVYHGVNQVKTALIYDVETTEDASEETTATVHGHGHELKMQQKTMVFGMETTDDDSVEATMAVAVHGSAGNEKSAGKSMVDMDMEISTTEDYASEETTMEMHGHMVQENFGQNVMEIGSDSTYEISSDSSYGISSDSSLGISSDSVSGNSDSFLENIGSGLDISSDSMEESEDSGAVHMHNNFVGGDVEETRPPMYDDDDYDVMDSESDELESAEDGHVLFTPVIAKNKGKTEVGSTKKAWQNWMQSAVDGFCSFYSVLVMAILNVLAICYCVCIRPILKKRMKRNSARIRMERLSEHEVDSSISDLYDDNNSGIDAEDDEC